MGLGASRVIGTFAWCVVFREGRAGSYSRFIEEDTPLSKKPLFATSLDLGTFIVRVVTVTMGKGGGCSI